MFDRIQIIIPLVVAIIVTLINIITKTDFSNSIISIIISIIISFFVGVILKIYIKRNIFPKVILEEENEELEKLEDNVKELDNTANIEEKLDDIE